MSIGNRKLIRKCTSEGGILYIAAADIKAKTPLTSTFGDSHGVQYVSLLSPFYQKPLLADPSCKHFRRRIRKTLSPLEDGGDGHRICKPIPCISPEYFQASRHLWTCDEGSYATYSSLSSNVYDVIVPSSSLSLGKNRRVNTEYEPIQGSEGEGTNDSIVSTEELFFKLRDPFPFDLPPPDDAASLDFWKAFKRKKEEYHIINKKLSRDSDVSSKMLGNVKISRVANPINSIGNRQCEQKNYGYAITTVRDVYEGEEITLHRGLEYWTDRLLRKVFLCADTPELLRHVRWIEGLCLAPLSVDRGIYQQPVSPDPFPSIELRNMLRAPQRSSSSSLSPVSHELKDPLCHHRRTRNLTRSMVKVLWNSVHNAVATDQEVLAYAVRQSCLSPRFTLDVGQHFLPIPYDAPSEGCHNNDARFLTIRDLRQLIRKDLILQHEDNNGHNH